jgi:hypothetical protein
MLTFFCLSLSLSSSFSNHSTITWFFLLSLPVSHAHVACFITKSNAIHSLSEYELDKCPTPVVVVHAQIYIYLYAHTYMGLYVCRCDDAIVWLMVWARRLHEIKKKKCRSVWPKKNFTSTKIHLDQGCLTTSASTTQLHCLVSCSCSHHLNYKSRNLIHVHKHIRVGCIKKNLCKGGYAAAIFFLCVYS